MSDPPSCTSSFCAPSGDAVRLAVVAAAANELTTSKRYIWCYIYNEFELHPLNIVWGLEWSEVWFVSGEQGFAECCGIWQSHGIRAEPGANALCEKTEGVSRDVGTSDEGCFVCLPGHWSFACSAGLSTTQTEMHFHALAHVL